MTHTSQNKANPKKPSRVRIEIKMLNLFNEENSKLAKTEQNRNKRTYKQVPLARPGQQLLLCVPITSEPGACSIVPPRAPCWACLSPFVWQLLSSALEASVPSSLNCSSRGEAISHSLHRISPDPATCFLKANNTQTSDKSNRYCLSQKPIAH